MKTIQIILFLFFLFMPIISFAQKTEKYAPSFPPPELLISGKTYHFESKKNGLNISLELQRKTPMSSKYAVKIEYPDKRIVSQKGMVYMRETYNLGSEEREKSGEVYSCQPFSPKNTNKEEHLEICVSYNEDDKNDKKTVSFSYFKKNYPKIEMLNMDEK